MGSPSAESGRTGPRDETSDDAGDDAGDGDGRRCRPAELANLTLRLLLLLVLVVGLVAAEAPRRATHRQDGDLVRELAAGSVSYVWYDRSTRTVLWTGTWWSWQEAPLASWQSEITIASNSEPTSSPTAAAEQWLRKKLDTSPRQVRFAEHGEHGDPTGPDTWPGDIPWPPLRVAVQLAEALAFLLMILRPDHRYANRWAWLWIFAYGHVGALVYPVLEPFPLWRKPWRPGPERIRYRGGAGLLWSWLLAVASSLALACGEALT